VFFISAINKKGTKELCGQALDYLEERWAAEADDPDLVEAEFAVQEAMQAEAKERIEELRERHRLARKGEDDGGDDFDDDDYDVDFEYVP